MQKRSVYIKPLKMFSVKLLTFVGVKQLYLNNNKMFNTFFNKKILIRYGIFKQF